MSGIFDSLRRLVNPTQPAPDHPADKPIVSAIKEVKLKPESAPEQARQHSYRDMPAPAALPPPAVVAPVTSIAPEPDSDDLDAAKDIVDTCNESDPQFAKAFDIVLADADTTDELSWLFVRMERSGVYEVRVLDKLKGLYLSFDDWKDAYDNEGEISAFRGACLGKAISTAKTNDDWVALWESVEDDSDSLQALKDELLASDWDEAAWESLRDATDGGSAFETFAFIKLISFKQTEIDVLKFYLDYNENWDTDDDVVKAMFDKLFSLTTRQEAQIISAMAGEDDALREAADEHLKS